MLLKEQLENYSNTIKNGKYVFPIEIEGTKINLEKWEPLYFDKILNNISKITVEIE